MQTTLAAPLTFTGPGVHLGRMARLVLVPAPADHGIVFRRTDVSDADALVPARWDRVVQGALHTRVENAEGTYVATIEHLMAALAGTGVQNVLASIDGPEVPVLDGSAAPFVRAILAGGIRRQQARLRAVEVLQTVRVDKADAWASLSPAPGLTLSFHIAFPDPLIGEQDLTLNLANGCFVRELCDSRTFCLRSDVERMREQGLGLGGTLDNAVVIDGGQVLTPGGLRRPDEAVRHKMLDALGDLATAGGPILGHYHGHKAGHALTNRLLRTLFATPGAWRLTPVDRAMAARLPGAGLGPDDLAAVA